MPEVSSPLGYTYLVNLVTKGRVQVVGNNLESGWERSHQGEGNIATLFEPRLGCSAHLVQKTGTVYPS